MLYKIGRDSKKRWRRLRGHRRLADVFEFKPFMNGLSIPDENRTESVQDAQAAKGSEHNI